MLNRCCVRMGRRLVPRWLIDQINPFDPFMRATVQKFVGLLPAHALVLDAGCGEAQYKPFFQRAGHRYLGIDLGVGEPDWEYNGINALANTEDLPFRPGIFDGVMSIAVLEHTPYPRKTLHELNGALKVGGQLLLVVPTMWEEHQMPHDYYRFTRYGIERLLKEAGFEVQERFPIGGYFWFMGRKAVDILEFFQPMPQRLLWPLLVIPFGFLLPIFLRHLDFLDKDKYYTIGQVCIAKKVSAPEQNSTGAGVLP